MAMVSKIIDGKMYAGKLLEEIYPLSKGFFDNFNIEMDAYNNRFFGIVDKPNYFSHEQGLSWVGNDPTGQQFDFDVTNLINSS